MPQIAAASRTLASSRNAGRGVKLGVALLAGLALAGCGNGENSARSEAVNSCLTQRGLPNWDVSVDSAQARIKVEGLFWNRTYASYDIAARDAATAGDRVTVGKLTLQSVFTVGLLGKQPFPEFTESYAQAPGTVLDYAKMNADQQFMDFMIHGCAPKFPAAAPRRNSLIAQIL